MATHIEQPAPRHAKPASSKGRYILKAFVSTTMGPSVPLDQNRTTNLTAAEDAA